MVYYQIHHPDAMPPALLDEYLAKGWYRMQQTIFTTDIIIKNEMVIPVFWIRLALKRYRPNKSGKKILELNARFSVTIKNGHITAEAEDLYQQYRSSVNFDLSETITDYLVGEAVSSIYPTKCIEIRDGKRLIAAGYFDEGSDSLAGILNIFHPEYKQYTPGKYLMLLKIGYAIEHNKQFYYPGYISTGISKFDYKLFPGKEATEVYISSSGQWVPWLSVTSQQLEESLFAGEGGEEGGEGE